MQWKLAVGVRTQTSDILFVGPAVVSHGGLGERGPSSHLEPASQPATQAALRTSQPELFLKGL